VINGGGPMGRVNHIQTAAGQAALLFVLAGALGLTSDAITGQVEATGSRLVNGLAIGLGLVVASLPWHRWNQRLTLVLVPAAFGLVATGEWFNPAGTTTVYGVWFVVVFAWIGSWHPPRTCLLVAPVGALAYIVPFLPGTPATSSDALATVVVGIPSAVALGEILAGTAEAKRRARESLEAAAELLQRANLTDDLTGVGNRRRANALLDAMVPGDGLVLLDLDNFKRINDSLGHDEGDRVLMELGRFLRSSVRDVDTIARFGGEEFLLVVRRTGRNLVPTVERLLAGWRATGAGVTLSAGVALHTADRGPTATFKVADSLLYEAKANGRDRLVAERAAVPAHLPG
jgi:diguanylate cyclase (GGDEF)-like protein